MIKFITKNNKIYFDIETMKNILNVSKSKIHRELKKQDTEIVKYKNVFLYPKITLLNLIEIIIIEKLKNKND
jgi:hypothetical protein